MRLFFEHIRCGIQLSFFSSANGERKKERRKKKGTQTKMRKRGETEYLMRSHLDISLLCFFIHVPSIHGNAVSIDGGFVE